MVYQIIYSLQNHLLPMYYYPLVGHSQELNRKILRMMGHPFADVEQAMELKDVAMVSGEETKPPTSGSSMGPSADLLAGTPVDIKEQQHCQPSVSHFGPIKQHLNEIIKDYKQENHRIFMDGVLHKIPCGQTLSDNTRKEVPDAPGLQCYPWGSLGNTLKRSRKKIKGLTRSHTLSEALDRYSRLLDITLSKESTPLPGGPKSIQKDDNHQGGMPPKCLGRIFSLPEIESHFFIQDDDSDYPETSMSEVMPITGAEDSLVLVQTQYFDKPLPTRNQLYIESLASASNIEDAMGVNANGMIDLHEQHKAELTTEQELCDPSGFDAKIADQIHQMPLNETEAGDEGRSSSKPTGLNLNLDLDLEERPCGPRTCSTQEDSEPVHINLEEIDALTSSKGKMENTEVYVSKVHIPWKTEGISDLHFEVDQKDEAVFNLVREMLSKCIYDSNEFRGAYQNAYEQLDTLLTGYADTFVHEHDSENAALEISADFQLLFDLITELLIRIYDISDSNFSWIPRFNYHIKPRPDEYHILEEVWTSIKYLSSQTPDDSMFEYLVTQDFLKNDGWTTLHVDMEYVGEELEELILDNLLEEVINLEF